MENFLQLIKIKKRTDTNTLAYNQIYSKQNHNRTIFHQGLQQIQMATDKSCTYIGL